MLIGLDLVKTHHYIHSAKYVDNDLQCNVKQSDSMTKTNSANITSDWRDILLRPSALIQEIKPTKEVFIQQYLALSCTHSALYQKTKLNENENM